MIPPLPWSHKFNDYLASSIGAGILAAINIVNLEAWLQVAVLVLTIIFLLFGIAMRAERFVARMSRAFFGEPISPAEKKKEEEETAED
jgi:hypothetical protein